MSWNPFKKQSEPAAQVAAAESLAAREPVAEPATSRKRLYAWAESPAQRRQIENSLSPEQWLILPTAQTGENLVGLIKAGKASGIVFLHREGTQKVMDSLRLLESECPECPRFVVCPDESTETFRSWQGIPPTVLKEGAVPAENDERILRGIALNQWLTQPAIRSVLPRLGNIPTLPAAHRRVVEALRDPNFSADDVARLVSQDLSLTANLFKTVNSAALGLGRAINTIPNAITMLGVERLQALVMSAWAFRFIDDRTCKGFDPQSEWVHAVAVAETARKLGFEAEAQPAVCEAAFTAGLLHDIGKLLLAANESEPYSMILADARDSDKQLWEIEKEDMGFSHAEMGACMLGIWGIALPIVEAVAWHHQPSLAPNQELSPLTLVHLADCQVRDIPPDPSQSKLVGTV